MRSSLQWQREEKKNSLFRHTLRKAAGRGSQQVMGYRTAALFIYFFFARSPNFFATCCDVTKA